MDYNLKKLDHLTSYPCALEKSVETSNKPIMNSLSTDVLFFFSEHQPNERASASARVRARSPPPNPFEIVVINLPQFLVLFARSTII